MRITEEVWLLAKHQRDILERRFPHYKCILHKSLSECWISVETDVIMILSASFTDSSILISLPALPPSHIKEVNYADPRFTENILSDVVGELEKVI